MEREYLGDNPLSNVTQYLLVPLQLVQYADDTQLYNQLDLPPANLAEDLEVMVG